MIKIPRNLSGNEFIKLLEKLGYHFVRQTGSHIRIRTYLGGEHSVTIPGHSSLKIGTISNILNDISTHHQITKEDLTEKLFGGMNQ
jgi:predicted RNA binding protein YcfA (HicA-like mRNA interferase family)